MRRRHTAPHLILLIAVPLSVAQEVRAQAGAQPPPPVPVTRLEERAAPVDLDSPRAVSLTISQPLPVRDALVMLVTNTPFSIVASDQVDGTFSGELKDLSLRQALQAVLFPRGLDYSLDGTVIRVHPQRPSMRLFDVSYLNVRRDWQRGVRSSAAVSGDPPAADATSSAAASFFDDIEKGVNALLSPSGRAHIDRHNGVVQVTDVGDRLERVGLYLETVQLRAMRQVRLDARVLEVTLTDPTAHSIDWKAVAERSGEGWLSVTRTGTGIRVADLTGVVKAIAEQGTVRMLAAPQVVAMNNEAAVMRVGTQDVFFTTTTSPGQGSSVERLTSPVPVLEGLTLTVIPQIAADGMVQLSVSPSLTEKTGEARSRQGERVPVLAIVEADTLVRLRDGEGVLIAGFLQDRARAKPAEGLAAFFGGGQSSEKVKSELVILLKASVVAPTPATPVAEVR